MWLAWLALSLRKMFVLNRNRLYKVRYLHRYIDDPELQVMNKDQIVPSCTDRTVGQLLLRTVCTHSVIYLLH